MRVWAETPHIPETRVFWFMAENKRENQRARSSKEGAGGWEPARAADDNGAQRRERQNGDWRRNSRSYSENPLERRNQSPIKLQFRIPRNDTVFNCAVIHKEWLEVMKRNDPSARVIAHKEVAISNVNNFREKNQVEYNKVFPQRTTRHPVQPRASEVVFEIETSEIFQSLKTCNK